MIQVDYSIKVAYIYHENIVKNIISADMNLFIPNHSIMNQSLDIFISLYNFQNVRNLKYWLLDVSDFEYIDDSIEGHLKSLQLDLDDNLFLYKHGNNFKNEITITEYYEIHSFHPRRSISYGKWDTINGLKITKEDKWIRRKNLEVELATIIFSFMLCILYNTRE